MDPDNNRADAMPAEKGDDFTQGRMSNDEDVTANTPIKTSPKTRAVSETDTDTRHRRYRGDEEKGDGCTQGRISNDEDVTAITPINIPSGGSLSAHPRSSARVVRPSFYDASDSVQVISLPHATPLEIEMIDNNNITLGDGNVVTAQIEEMVIKIDRRKTIQAVIIAICATVLIVGLTVLFLFRTTQPTPMLPIRSPKLQRQTLLKLYERTGGSNWTKNEHWLGKDHECTWYGISCNTQMAVTKIELVLNNLKGTIGEDDLLGSLNYVEVLNLSKNKLTGTLPEMLGSLTSLSILDLQRNGLRGTLPDILGSLTKMRELNFGKNELTGMLPDSLGSLSNWISKLRRSIELE
eukprot:CAMPEP_0194299812 /NCGR_PEP_ID=MMETSP0169-20130528/60913_1 /TAXON_ID=218684 /ORGANISM="Corethron pennatum, Strain L29A3" /LENGTH=350 /DNA_ID=CAMNT_0039049931 /DNA_START=111 /DNA_END=1163 /DNA_ORIENTATION=-